MPYMQTDCIVSAAVSGQDIIVFGTSATGEPASSLTSQDSNCITQMIELGCIGSRPIDVCVQGTCGNMGSSVMAWALLCDWGKRGLVVLDGPMNQQVYRGVLYQSLLPWAQAGEPAREVIDWPSNSPNMIPIEWPDDGSYPRHWWSSYYGSTIAWGCTARLDWREAC